MAEKDLDIITTPNFNDEIEDAVAKKHAQNTDTELGALTADINSNGHIVVDSDDAVSDDIFNKIIVNAKNIKFICFDSYDMIDNAVSGTGSVSQDFGRAKVRTGANANSYARQNFNTQTGVGLYSGDKLGWYIYTTALTGDVVGFAGHIRDVLLTTEVNHTLTDKHAGLFYDNGVFYASTADGTTQELTDVTASIAGQNWLKMTFDGTSVRFYWGDTLIATHTTYLATYGNQQIWISNKANALDKYMVAYSFYRKGST